MLWWVLCGIDGCEPSIFVANRLVGSVDQRLAVPQSSWVSRPWWDVGNPIMNLPFGHGLYRPFMVILGMISWFTTWTIFHRESSHFPPWNQPFEVLFGRTSLGPGQRRAENCWKSSQVLLQPGVLQGPFDFRPWLGDFGQGQTLVNTVKHHGAFG